MEFDNYNNLKNQQYDESDNSFELIISELVPTLTKKEQIELYESLCNVIWYNVKKKLMYSVSWRYAGSIIAKYDNDSDSSYLKYYCSGNEGNVKNWIEKYMEEKNWKWCYYD